jgi:hypothetical protein
MRRIYIKRFPAYTMFVVAELQADGRWEVIDAWKEFSER